jgi:GNS1/SUR4 family
MLWQSSFILVSTACEGHDHGVIVVLFDHCNSPCSHQTLTFFFSHVSFEEKYDPVPVLDWMRENPMIPVGACVAYGVLIMAGQYAMQNRESWNWRRIMAFWNLSLSVFSWIGMARTLPQLLHNLYYMSVRDNLCMDRKSDTSVFFSLRGFGSGRTRQFAFRTTFASLSLILPFSLSLLSLQ